MEMESEINGLHANVKKTNYMVVTKKSVTPALNLFVSVQQIQYGHGFNRFSYLGS